tara:strand:- start:514 stop:1122 length:609 start_codon:yes stop_codon:yes gene_type:complete
MIVKDKKELMIPCEPCSSVEEGEEIGAKLLHELTHSKVPGIGLAANQIGINKRVCVINVKEPVVLVNPKIVKKSKDKFLFLEGCLSFDGELVKTARYKDVIVEADNHTSKLHFGIWAENNEEGYNKEDKLNYALETACVQHEIDHLDGITMFDREFKQEPLKRKSEKIGRNTKVLIKKDNETKEIKFKKFNKFEKEGWVLTS